MLFDLGIYGILLVMLGINITVAYVLSLKLKEVLGVNKRLTKLLIKKLEEDDEKKA